MFKKSKNLLQPKFLKYFHLLINDVDSVFRSLSKFSPATAFSISFTSFSMRIIYSIFSLSSIFSGAAVEAVSELYRFVCCERDQDQQRGVWPALAVSAAAAGHTDSTHPSLIITPLLCDTL